MAKSSVASKTTEAKRPKRPSQSKSDNSWTPPHGQLEDVQFGAERIDDCIQLFHESLAHGRPSPERLFVLLDALQVQYDRLVQTINFTAEQLTTKKKAVA